MSAVDEGISVRGNRVAARVASFGALVFAVLVVVLTTPAAGAAPSPAPHPTRRPCPSVVLNPITLKLDLPPVLRNLTSKLGTDLGRLLCDKKAPPTPTTAAPPPAKTTTAPKPAHPAPRATTHSPQQRLALHPHHARTIDTAPQSAAPTPIGQPVRRPRHTQQRSAASTPVSRGEAASVLRAALPQDNPVMLLAGVTGICSLGIAGVVFLGGRRHNGRHHA